MSKNTLHLLAVSLLWLGTLALAWAGSDAAWVTLMILLLVPHFDSPEAADDPEPPSTFDPYGLFFMAMGVLGAGLLIAFVIDANFRFFEGVAGWLEPLNAVVTSSSGMLVSALATLVWLGYSVRRATDGSAARARRAGK